MAGSGIDLTGLLDTVTQARPFKSFPGLERSTVTGHESRFLLGTCSGLRVVIQCGRLHVYEGYAPDKAARTVDILRGLGVHSILFTNAVGGLLPEMTPGQLLSVTRMRLWPYRHWRSQPEVLKTDFIVPDCPFTGEAAWVHGPSYETRAEIIGLQRLGAMAVGMSTAPELERCRALGIRAAVVSCITNNCCDAHVLTHDEVIETAKGTSACLVNALRGAVTATPQPAWPKTTGRKSLQ